MNVKDRIGQNINNTINKKAAKAKKNIPAHPYPLLPRHCFFLGKKAPLGSTDFWGIAAPSLGTASNLTACWLDPCLRTVRRLLVITPVLPEYQHLPWTFSFILKWREWNSCRVINIKIWMYDLNVNQVVIWGFWSDQSGPESSYILLTKMACSKGHILWYEIQFEQYCQSHGEFGALPNICILTKTVLQNVP